MDAQTAARFGIADLRNSGPKSTFQMVRVAFITLVVGASASDS